MKKILIACFVVTAIITSCKKDDNPVFDKTADERIKEALDGYQAQLSGAENGWNGIIKADSGRGASFSFYFKFNNENRVIMLSDFDSLSAVTPKESSYRLKALQQPSLIFDTYSYLHVLADPDETVNGGVRGAGLLSDFEFYFDSKSTDSIVLVGRINGSKMVLTRATKADADLYNAGQLAAGLNINKILTYFKRLTVGSQLYDVKIDPINRQFVFSWLDGSGNLQTFATSYYFIAGGIVFTNPFVNGSQTISGFTNMSWDQSTETITLSANGATATIKGIVVPLKVDIGAPKRWRDYAINNQNSFWASQSGFHVNGVDDAFGIQSLTSGTNTYFFLAYWPEYDPGNDLFGPVFLNAAGTALTLAYATAPAPPTFTSDGRAIFVQLGNYGPYPNTGPAGQSRALLYNSSGYYFVQTSATTYDMVSASNGKSWISWEF
ncbi:MAG: DUF4302 domain-containing protein [Chitinophagaceae bacterium]